MFNTGKVIPKLSPFFPVCFEEIVNRTVGHSKLLVFVMSPEKSSTQHQTDYDLQVVDE